MKHIVILNSPMYMKEINVKDDCVFFEDKNGEEHVMYYDHFVDCCENNYADWLQMDDLAKGYTFKDKLLFESVDGGFRFGDNPLRMFFVPCYSEQNGYYTKEVDIYFDGDIVLEAYGEFINNE